MAKSRGTTDTSKTFLASGMPNSRLSWACLLIRVGMQSPLAGPSLGKAVEERSAGHRVLASLLVEDMDVPVASRSPTQRGSTGNGVLPQQPRTVDGLRLSSSPNSWWTSIKPVRRSGLNCQASARCSLAASSNFETCSEVLLP